MGGLIRLGCLLWVPREANVAFLDELRRRGFIVPSVRMTRLWRDQDRGPQSFTGNSMLTYQPQKVS
jgi:hypothetical protein